MLKSNQLLKSRSEIRWYTPASFWKVLKTDIFLQVLSNHLSPSTDYVALSRSECSLMIQEPRNQDLRKWDWHDCETWNCKDEITYQEDIFSSFNHQMSCSASTWLRALSSRNLASTTALLPSTANPAYKYSLESKLPEFSRPTWQPESRSRYGRANPPLRTSINDPFPTLPLFFNNLLNPEIKALPK